MSASKAHILIPMLSSATTYKLDIDHYQLVIANAGRLRGK